MRRLALILALVLTGCASTPGVPPVTYLVVENETFDRVVLYSVLPSGEEVRIGEVHQMSARLPIRARHLDLHGTLRVRAERRTGHIPQVFVTERVLVRDRTPVLRLRNHFALSVIQP